MKLYNDGNPFVSVVLPTFNRANLISRAINSVFAQKFSDWELIVVDDGSNDETFEVIGNYLVEQRKIKYVKQNNMKLPVALNTGIALSAGQYVTFLGSDDEYSPEHLDLRVKIVRENPRVDLLYGGVKIIGNPYVPDKNDVRKKIHLSKCIIGGTFFGKKEMFVASGGFALLDYAEDSEFFERAKKTYVVRKVNYETYIYYRDSEDSITNNLAKENKV